MAKSYKITTTVPGNVSINLPDGQTLKSGKVLIVDESVISNSGVAKYIEIGRIVIVAEGTLVPKTDEDVPAGDAAPQKAVKPKPARKAAAAKVDSTADAEQTVDTTDAPAEPASEPVAEPVAETAPEETPAS
ncbi:MAG TPA: hypothetical protein VFM18_21255 [Methanosarcina sp.]|nr:hypothetical protein [Methanosarcina sp.]